MPALAVLEVNVCSGCGLIIELVRGVGWLHVAPRPYHHEWSRCVQPTPHWLRCSVCHTSMAGTSRGLMGPHGCGFGDVPVLCPGVGQPGVQPRGEAEALEEDQG